MVALRFGESGEGDANQAAVDLEGRLLLVEETARRLSVMVAGHATQIQEENKRVTEELARVNNQLQGLQEVIARQNRVATQLEQQVDGVRSDSSAGIVASIIVFALLFLISLFIR